MNTFEGFYKVNYNKLRQPNLRRSCSTKTMTTDNHDIRVDEIIIIWNAFDYQKLKKHIQNHWVELKNIYGFFF